MEGNKSIPKKRTHFLASQKVAPYVFVAPFILSFSVLTLYPTIKAFIMSFQRILPGQVTFIGLSNYVRIFNTPTFFKALQNTTIYMILTVIILVTIPILLATILNSQLVRFRTFLRSGLFIPALTSVVVAGII